MEYYSLNNRSIRAGFREAATRGLAPDKGLYFPGHIPVTDPQLMEQIETYSKSELGFRILLPYVGDAIPEEVLYRIVEETVDFPFPLVQVRPQIASLELYHGATLAFKDVGARFMSRCLGYFSRDNKKKITVLVATSGDTGGAVASGFLGVEGVEVVILYPAGKVSAVQELQLTTCGQNITALKVAGNFDDCQSMVKAAFMDATLQTRLQLTSANSINVARWLPQQLYYFYAWQQWQDKAHPPVIAVPSGNYGNLSAGLLAYKSGLPVENFIAASNENDIVPEFLSTGAYIPRPVVTTLSNAMDVGDPSNFVRMMELFSQDAGALGAMVAGHKVSDAETMDTLKKVYGECQYLLDPHGAVAYRALEEYLLAHPGRHGYILETAHPVKFPDTVQQATGNPVPEPPAVRQLYSKLQHFIDMPASPDALKEWLLSR